MQTWLETIPQSECRDLLATAVLGRLGVVVDGRPEIFPINHVFDPVTGQVAFPTNRRTKLHAALSWPWVAFEVDGVADEGARGWSVMVVGKAEEVHDRDLIAGWMRSRAAKWASGEGAAWVTIVPSKIDGRRISATGV